MANEWKYPLILMFLWFILTIIVNPIGDFPLNDDWQYAYPVKTLLEGEGYQLRGIFSPNIFVQVIWGYLFHSLSGDFSFTILRISVLILAGIGLLLYFQIGKKIASSGMAFTAALVLLFNPLFFGLSYSFMTDVPFLAFVMAGILAYWRYLETDRSIFRVLGFLLSVLAFLLRQPGILLLIRFELTLFVVSPKKMKDIASVAFALAVAVGSYWVTESILKPSLGLKEHYLSVDSLYFTTLLENPASFFIKFTQRTLMSIFYLGLFCLPFINFIIKWSKSKQLLRMPILATITIANAVLAAVLYKWGYIFPFGGNVIQPEGFGPILTYDYWPEKLIDYSATTQICIMSFGLLVQIYACYVFMHFVESHILPLLKSSQKNTVQETTLVTFRRFIVLLLCSYLAVVMVISYFDRYMLLPSALLFLLFLPNIPKQRYSPLTLVLLLCFAWYAIMGTKDYLQMHRVIHRLADDSRIPPTELTSELARESWEHGNWWQDRTRTYVIALSELEGFQAIDSLSYFKYYQLKPQQVYLLKRNHERSE